jgi:hypothetical protein
VVIAATYRIRSATSTGTRLYQACLRHGEGDQDNSIVIEEIRRRVL